MPPAGPAARPGRAKVDRDAPPIIKPAAPAPGAGAGRDLIPIAPGSRAQLEAARSKGHISPWTFWSNYYKQAHPKIVDEAADLRDTLRLLNVNKKFVDVQAAVTAFLLHRPKLQEAWMYEALAIAIELNKGKPEQVKQSLGYAADMALTSGNPNLLVSVADQLFLHGQYERIGNLIDLAMEKVPHRGEPIVMSINLASKTKDPKRMAASIDRLLSLGWPGIDDKMRLDARRQAELLAKTLHEDGRDAEAEALLAGLPASESRDLYIRLTWTGPADLDLRVEEPLGATAQYLTPRTVFGGALLKNGYGSHPEEVYVCPRGFDGDYTVRVEVIANDEKRPTSQATLEVIAHEGTPREKKETHTIALRSDGKPSEPVVVHLTGGRRKEALPYVAPVVIQMPPPRVKKPAIPPTKPAAAGALKP